MNVSYKLDGNKKYLVFENIEINENNYKWQMYLNNNINGLLKIELRYIDNDVNGYVDISGLVCFKDWCVNNKITESTIVSFINSFSNVLIILKEYLLDSNSLCIAMDKIYVDEKRKDYYFCYIPGKVFDIKESLEKFTEELLYFVDYSNDRNVRIAYGIQQLVRKYDFVFEDLKKYLQEFETQYENNEIEHESIGESNETENYYNNVKEGFFTKLKRKLFAKNNYVGEDEIEVSHLDNKESINLYDYHDYNTELLDEKNTVLLEPQQVFVPSIILKCNWNEQTIMICPKKSPWLVGKSHSRCDFVIDNDVVSRVHLKISFESYKWSVEDMGSTNGTFYNGQKLEKNTVQTIQAGDIITIANMDFIVEEKK